MVTRPFASSVFGSRRRRGAPAYPSRTKILAWFSVPSRFE
jgi:hypothetical protein